MAFPTNPTNGQTYTNALGTMYQYFSARNAWEIVSQAVTGNQGATGSQGAAGAGTTGLQGVTGQGFTGLIGQTGARGITGVQGLSGVLGPTGANVNAGLYNAGTVTGGGFNVNWSRGVKQYATVGSAGASGLIYFTSGVTGANSVLELRYTYNSVPAGWTGARWPGGTAPVLTGYTGSSDVVSFFYNGQAYLGVASTDFR